MWESKLLYLNKYFNVTHSVWNLDYRAPLGIFSPKCSENHDSHNWFSRLLDTSFHPASNTAVKLATSALESGRSCDRTSMSFHRARQVWGIAVVRIRSVSDLCPSPLLRSQEASFQLQKPLSPLPSLIPMSQKSWRQLHYWRHPQTFLTTVIVWGLFYKSASIYTIWPRIVTCRMKE
jgi:hypothetical protein